MVKVRTSQINSRHRVDKMVTTILTLPDGTTYSEQELQDMLYNLIVKIIDAIITMLRRVYDAIISYYK